VANYNTHICYTYCLPLLFHLYNHDGSLQSLLSKQWSVLSNNFNCHLYKNSRK